MSGTCVTQVALTPFSSSVMTNPGLVHCMSLRSHPAGNTSVTTTSSPKANAAPVLCPSNSTLLLKIVPFTVTVKSKPMSPPRTSFVTLRAQLCPHASFPALKSVIAPVKTKITSIVFANRCPDLFSKAILL